jgi:sugar (pentulose or hexulose) kinase
MREGVLVGLDIGTTLCKAAVVSEGGVELAHGFARTPWESVATGAELAPADLLEAALEAIDEALSRVPRAHVLALGVTSMAETGVLIDARGDPVAPSIAWHDTRGESQARGLADRVGAEAFTARTGLPPTRLCSAAKYRWLRENDSAARRGTRWLSVAEWIVHALGGEQLAELSLASRTGFLDAGRAAWWPEALAWAEAPPGFLPELCAAATEAGRARRTRLEGAVLTVAGHDHLAAAVGAGATRHGDLFDSCGSAEALVRAVAPGISAQAIQNAVAGGVTVGWHVFGENRSLLGGFLSGLALRRFLDLLGVADDAREALGEAAIAAPPGANGLRILEVAADTATLTGIGPDVSPALVWRAALEATQRRAAEIRATIELVAGPSERLVVSGGWSHDAAVRAVKHEVLGPFDRPPVTEAGARGAGVLAGVAAGLYSGIDEIPGPDHEREAMRA